MDPQPYDDLDAADLLALCVWREARGEPDDGMLGVAHSVLNRVARPGWWGSTIHSVILQPAQYASFSADDPNNVLWPLEADETWHASKRAAQDAIGGAPDPTDGATNYHAIDIPFPKGWGSPKEYERKPLIGKHQFYRMV